MAKTGEKKGGTSMLLQIALVILIIALSFFVLKMYVFDKMNDELSKLDGQIAELDLKVKKAQAFQQKKALNEQIYNSRLAELEREKKILPKERETDELVRRLENLAHESRDLKITLFRPDKPVDHEFYYEWPITINCEASYSSIGQFFEQVANFDRILNVYNLKLESTTQGSDARPTLKAGFIASTFVYTGDATEKIQ
ncbi:MAG TPA: type 4a pilus biogenesis protein PilO [Acidobacteriota bacterium]|nr:type 4a pilus biogenesis protein PilO [Acidobacteriota bacterium]HQM61728.1 type 4a pilus biogenesis protein PilO [Acidobacteriota bacterium]